MTAMMSAAANGWEAGRNGRVGRASDREGGASGWEAGRNGREGEGWEIVRARARAATAGLPAVPEPGPGVCATCRGPARRGFARCFHCGLHVESAPGVLADVVAPVACAPKGSRLATDLWLYKSERTGSREAGAALLAMLLVFLHDRAPGLWRAAAAVPTCACVVPSGRGRPGAHPLRALVHGCLALPWAALVARPGGDTWARALDPGRFRAPRPLNGAAVLLLDDTWTSGGTAQSAAVALKRAGARRVAVVVLGRHLPPIAAPATRQAGHAVPAAAPAAPMAAPAVRSGPAAHEPGDTFAQHG
jgi:hypothetical protein